MKTKLLVTILALTTGFAFGHGSVELGPNKGRILEFSTNESMHGEVTEKDGKLFIAVLDKDMKPVAIAAQEITATAGTRDKPFKIGVTRETTAFSIAAPKAGEWIIFQFKENAGSKPITARLHYDTKVCAPCSNPEWRCACKAKG